MKTHLEKEITFFLRNAVADTKLVCEVEENAKHNRWRITLRDSSHPNSYQQTSWMGNQATLWVKTGIEMVLMHIASRETFYQEIGQHYADLLHLVPGSTESRSQHE
jgi:hypothetical protein